MELVDMGVEELIIAFANDVMSFAMSSSETGFELAARFSRSNVVVHPEPRCINVRLRTHASELRESDRLARR